MDMSVMEIVVWSLVTAVYVIIIIALLASHL